ncbi:MAG: hypothetical protein M5U12_21405 [Verrucomicrobia bacterium]|nr:hypothetical protein [Verrucomicrobiota bacterium]
MGSPSEPVPRPVAAQRPRAVLDPPIKGEHVANARAGGDFCRVVLLGDRQPTLTVVGEHEGRLAWTTRTFQLTD